MKDQIYYLIPGQEQSNISDETIPLQVNCVGYCKRPHPYTHTHPVGRNDYFLQYITEDELIIQSDGKYQKHPKGSFIIHPPKKPYSYYSPDSRAEFFHVRFTGFHVGRLLAAMEHLGVSRYREVFHEQMGMSPIDYRTSLRIRRACELLSQTDLAVSEIAQDSGFTDIFYFARMFKAKTGVTPNKYRDNEKREKAVNSSKRG